MISLALTCLLLANLNDAADLNARIEEAYFDSQTGFYREETGKNDKAFDWTLGILISAQNALAQLDPTKKTVLTKTLEMGNFYWNPKGPVAGFDVLPGPRHPNDRYYDDNEWMVMSLVESYEITKDHRWLDRAQDALKFVLSGESPKLGGGIYWRESDKASKNTCSNGPAAAACLAVYHLTREKALLSKAKSLYAWTKKNLEDPTDGLYFDSINLDGKLGTTKWTYNSALMLRSARDLYRETHDRRYKADLERLQAACLKHWVREDGSIDDELQFAHLLFENLDPAKFDATKCIIKLKSSMKENGFFGTK
jgi:rhamnogalacturonyl hydrolase YesR